MGFPKTAKEFVQRLHSELETAAQEADIKYPANTSLVINERGEPVLKKTLARQIPASAMEFEAELKTNKVIAQLQHQHRSVEFRQFLDVIEAQVPAELDVHIIVDNYGTHKTALIRKWFAKRPRFHIHFTPTYGSWINLVERWFAELTNKRIRRGVFRSVKELEAAIREYIDVHNEDPKPFVWTKTADQILASIARYAQRTTAAQAPNL